MVNKLWAIGWGTVFWLTSYAGFDFFRGKVMPNGVVLQGDAFYIHLAFVMSAAVLGYLLGNIWRKHLRLCLWALGFSLCASAAGFYFIHQKLRSTLEEKREQFFEFSGIKNVEFVVEVSPEEAALHQPVLFCAMGVLLLTIYLKFFRKSSELNEEKSAEEV